MQRALAIGLALGLIISFIDSYSYVISGFTTAEISVVLAPLLLLIMSSVLGLKLTREELVIASALAIGIDITTTLTAGMYVTYGFLAYSSRRLEEFGLSISVPQELFSSVQKLIDLNAMPTYISLSLASVSGAFFAYALRMHYIERERLIYPLGIVAAMIIKSLRSVRKRYLIALLIGFFSQLLVLRFTSMIDLTPLVSSTIPGSILAVSVSPLMIALFMLLPLGSLKFISLGSLLTYLLILPIIIALLDLPVVPMMSYEDALFAYSNVVASLTIGMIFVLVSYYMLMYRKVFRQSFRILMYMIPERVSFIIGLALLGLIVPVAYALMHNQILSLSTALMFVTVLLLHILLVLVNLRVVGETGIGSQAVLPLVTLCMYLSKVRNVGVYAALDPFTGIPMPQVIGGTAMNIIRFSRLNGVKVSRTLMAFILGIVIGSFATYIYGNLLVAIYGFDSPQMPLHRWIPTIVWMAIVYSGSKEALYVKALIVGIVIGLVLVILNAYRNIALFPLIVGVTLPPDVGLTAFVVSIAKSVLVRMGVDVHEKALLTSVLALLGCGLAVFAYTMIIGVS